MSEKKKQFIFSIIKLKQQITSRNQSVQSTESFSTAGVNSLNQYPVSSAYTRSLYERVSLQGCSSESSGFSLWLKKSEDVILSNWSFHVSDKGSLVVSHESNFNLCNTSSGA